jgi:hypothetical protein
MTTSAHRTALAVAGFLVVAGFFLTTEHRAHLFGFLPFLLLLACPLLHLFAHGGHGSHGRPDEPDRRSNEAHAGHGPPPREVS